MHEGDGDEEMVRAVSNGTRFRVPSHARSLAHRSPPSQHSPDFLLLRHCHHLQSMDFQICAFYTFGSHPPQPIFRFISPLATTITHLPP
jgi:hypothetical protein